MTSKELSKLIREFVKAEIQHQKAEIIKEVKAELFDIMISANTPKMQNESVTTTTSDLGRQQLRDMFTQKLGMDTVSFNTKNVNLMSPMELPSTYQGGAIGEQHKDAINAINKDYSSLMKKMGI